MLWPQSPSWVGVPLYMILGSAVVPVAPTLIEHVGHAPFLLLLVSGMLYSAGAILYATKWPNPWPNTFGHHEFFHAATVLAAICHLVAVGLVMF
jgi:hemolysin III